MVIAGLEIPRGMILLWARVWLLLSSAFGSVSMPEKGESKEGRDGWKGVALTFSGGEESASSGLDIKQILEESTLKVGLSVIGGK